jgi:hypothetical protein
MKGLSAPAPGATAAIKRNPDDDCMLALYLVASECHSNRIRGGAGFETGHTGDRPMRRSATGKKRNASAMSSSASHEAEAKAIRSWISRNPALRDPVVGWHDFKPVP